VFLDVNGKKAPNTFGRDVFAFMLASNGKLYAGGTKEYGCLIEAAVYGNCWADRYTWDGTQYPNNGCLYLNQGKNVSGFGCAGRIIADGWKMDY
jgi:hypothetical protein